MQYFLGFRPGFKYYNMWVSLAGAIVCVAIMFVMNWPTALATFFVFAAIFLFLKKNKPGKLFLLKKLQYTVGYKK